MYILLYSHYYKSKTKLKLHLLNSFKFTLMQFQMQYIMLQNAIIGFVIIAADFFLFASKLNMIKY